jgi:hypothetical protein
MDPLLPSVALSSPIFVHNSSKHGRRGGTRIVRDTVSKLKARGCLHAGQLDSPGAQPESAAAGSGARGNEQLFSPAIMRPALPVALDRGPESDDVDMSDEAAAVSLASMSGGRTSFTRPSREATAAASHAVPPSTAASEGIVRPEIDVLSPAEVPLSGCIVVHIIGAWLIGRGCATAILM